MEELLRLMLKLVAYSIVAAAASGAECSLEVHVLNPAGEMVEARVALEESSGRKLRKFTETGVVEFCDLGILPVNVTVGHESCNQVVVKNIPLQWPERAIVKIIYDRRPCLLDPPPPANCSVLLRVAGADFKWLPFAEIQIDSPYQRSLRADQYGRILLSVPIGSSVSGHVLGAAANRFKRSCAEGRTEVEEIITVSRGAGPVL